jgi:NAD-dependent SIR2 family protein deacetylase
MNRKYRQNGYQDNDTRSERKESRGPKTYRDGPRSPQMVGMEQVIRCSNCGTKIPRASSDDIELNSTCPKCNASLHTCKHCAYFDPSQRFECTQPVTKRIERKDLPAKCDLFEIRTTVEKVTSTRNKTPESARDAFNDLFDF